MQAQRIKNLFSAIARYYDFLNSLLSLKRDKMWRRETVKASAVEPTHKVLDVCTGTGELALAYSDTIGAEGFVIGSDFCFEMLVIGDQKVETGRGKQKRGRLEERQDEYPQFSNLPTFQSNALHASTVSFQSQFSGSGYPHAPFFRQYI